MAVRSVRIWPDQALREKSSPVVAADGSVKGMVDDMFATMYESNGIGLAANQIGVQKRVVVIDLDPHGQAKRDEEVRAELAEWNFQGPVVLVNPVIKSRTGKIVWEEGCLSVPGINEDVTRAETVEVSAHDPDGQELEIVGHGLYAVCLQHELDHLEGKVFVDYLSKLKRDVIRRKMERLIEKQAPEDEAPRKVTIL